MKEKSDNNNILDYSKYKYLIDNLDIGKNKNLSYRQILLSKEYVTVVFNNNNSSSIQINTNTSFGRICSLCQKYPQEVVFFEVNKDESMSVSKSQDFKSLNKLKTKEGEDDHLYPNNNLYLSNKTNFDYLEFKDSSHKLNNLNSLTKLTSSEKFFYYYIKCLYIIYFIFGSVIFIHSNSLILLTKYKIKSFYYWISFLLFLAMLYMGYIGFSKFNGVEKKENSAEENYNHDTIFWYNFYLLSLTLTCFIFLIKDHCLEIKEEKIFGFIMLAFYITVIFIEVGALLFFDLTNRIYHLKTNEEYILLDEENERLIEI